MRKNYIDNIRWLSILLLFPYHTAMIYNDFGENFYVRGPGILAVSGFVLATSSWFMPMLFVLAGISTKLALQKRTPKEYVSERVNKLLTPLFFGMLLLVPVQTYFAERFHNGYTGGYLQQYILFFTKETDLTGYTGGFTPAHLWFLFYLFVISLVALPILIRSQKAKKKLPVEKLTVLKLIPLFLIPLIMVPILNINGKSIGEYLGLFLLGYFVLSCDEVILQLEAARIAMTVASVLLTAFGFFLHYNRSLYPSVLGDCYQRLVMWVCILALLGLAKHSFDFRTKATAYLAKACFPVYIFHQSILVAVAYFVFQFTSAPAVQIALILPLSFIFTFAVYELFCRIPLTRFLFGMKK